MLAPVDIDIDNAPLPAAIELFLEDADDRIEMVFRVRRHANRFGFFPSDYPLVYRTLHAARQMDEFAESLCEWGSGLGVVVGLAAALEFEACGIEIDPDLVRASRRLLGDHGLECEIMQGSFLPADYVAKEQFSDEETRTALTGAGALDEVDVEIRDFDVIYAFPWPAEHEMYLDLFEQYAAVGALLLTYNASEGVHAYRKK